MALSQNGYCSCGVGAIQCDKQFIYIKQGTCMTWDNATSSAEMHHCLFVQKGDNTWTMQNVYRIPINATGENLNHLTCGDYNRQRTYCSQCIEGYGPALFSGDATCADCSI